MLTGKEKSVVNPELENAASGVRVKDLEEVRLTACWRE